MLHAACCAFIVHLHARDVREEMAKFAARAFEQPFRAELLAVVLIEHRTASSRAHSEWRWTTGGS